MSISGLNGSSPAGSLGSVVESLRTMTPRSDAAGEGGALPFADLVKGLVADASGQHAQVQTHVEQLVTGELDNIHDVVLAAARADLAFQLVMEIRDRAIASYQEVMRMQV